jgi:HEAT repeat protein
VKATADREAPKSALPPPKTETELQKRLDDLLRDYDALLADKSYGMGPDQRPLAERLERIEALVREIAALGPAAVPALEERLRRDVSKCEHQTFFVRALARIPGDEALKVLADALAGCDRWGMRGPDVFTLKMTIVNQMFDHSGAAGMTLLAQKAPGEPDYRVRGRIVHALARARAPEAAPLAERLASTDPDPNVRVAAVKALADLEDPVNANALERIARSADDLNVKQHAIQAYARLAKDGALSFLEEIIRTDSNFRVKAATIVAITDVGGERALALLERIAADPTQMEDIRARARTGMEAIAKRAAQPGSGGSIQNLEELKLDRPLPLKPLGRPGGVKPK